MNRDTYMVYREAYEAAVQAGLIETAAAVREILKRMRAEGVTRRGNLIYLGRAEIGKD